MTTPLADTSGQDGNDEPEKGVLASFLRTEAFILGFGTAGIYIFSYFFQKTFLSHFAVPATFVELTLSTSVIAASFVVFAIVTIWNLMIFFPVKPLIYFFRIVYAFFGFIMILIFAASSFWLGGFTWVSISLIGALVFVFLIILESLLRSLRKGNSFERWLSSQMEEEDKAREKFVGQQFMDGLGREVALILLLLTVVPYFCGFLLGNWSASRASEFSALELDGTVYVIVSAYDDGFVLASVVPAASAKATYYTSGNTVWMSLDKLDQIAMRTVRGFIASKPIRVPNRWTTWPVFWEQVWGEPAGTDRP